MLRRPSPLAEADLEEIWLVSDLAATQEAAAIGRAIIQLASTLGITTTAEGVGTEGQMDLLPALNCHALQGYLIASPMTRERVDNLLNVLPEKIAAASEQQKPVVSGRVGTRALGPPSVQTGPTRCPHRF